jgi:hypothetical protein
MKQSQKKAVATTSTRGFVRARTVPVPSYAIISSTGKVTVSTADVLRSASNNKQLDKFAEIREALKLGAPRKVLKPAAKG